MRADSSKQPRPGFQAAERRTAPPAQGFDQIIRAIAACRPHSKKVHYTVAGSRGKGDYTQQLQQLASQHEVQLRIELDLSQAQLAAHYQNADLFCLTSVPYRNSVEGFGLVYLEAGAYGLPALAYDTGGVRDAVQDAITGRLVTSGDLQGLSQQLQRWVEDPAALNARTSRPGLRTQPHLEQRRRGKLEPHATSS